TVGRAAARALGRLLACRPPARRHVVSSELGVNSVPEAPTPTLPRLRGRASEAKLRTGGGPLVAVQGPKKHFPITKGVFSRLSGQVYAVDGVSFEIRRGETLGLVGESGCGKSTVGRTLLKLLEPTEGKIIVHGRDITGLDRDEMLPYRRQM